MILMLADNFKSILKKHHQDLNFTKLDEDIKKWCALM